MPLHSEAALSARRARSFGIGAVAILLGGVAAASMQPRVAGQFHDDGIYLATAQSLASGDGYRHASLPTRPVQTKYPPLYSTLLAGVWKLAPEHPANIVWFKGLSAVFLVGVVVLAGWLGTRVLGGTIGPITFALLVGANPLVFPFSDYPLTELPFLALCLAALGLAAGEHERPDSTIRCAVALGAVCGLAFLIRTAAVPLIGAAVLVYATRRRWRALVAFAVPLTLLAVPWLWFKAAHASDSTNALLAYYTGYEPSVPQLGAADPALGVQIVLANLYYLWTALDLGAYVTYFPAARVLLYPILLLGLWRLFRRPLAFLPAFAVFYAGLILLWPWHPSRYAIPLAPLIPLALLAAGRFLSDRASGIRTDRGLERRALDLLPWAPATLVVLMALGWVATFAPREPGTTRMAFLARLEYDWAGFEETADWLRDHTPPEAVLASAYDPLYYLRTGRLGVRPWLHRPWTYFYPVGDSMPDIGDPDEIQAALEELGADYLVVDPLEGYLEKEAAARLYDALLERYTPPAFVAPPVLRFVSSDSLHRVYELPLRAKGPGGLPVGPETPAPGRP